MLFENGRRGIDHSLLAGQILQGLVRRNCHCRLHTCKANLLRDMQWSIKVVTKSCRYTTRPRLFTQRLAECFLSGTTWHCTQESNSGLNTTSNYPFYLAIVPLNMRVSFSIATCAYYAQGISILHYYTSRGAAFDGLFRPT